MSLSNVYVFLIKFDGSVFMNNSLYLSGNRKGEETGFPSSELERHGPTINGWKSSKSPSPVTSNHELILQLESRARLGHIQILGHQYLIRKCEQITTNSFNLIINIQSCVRLESSAKRGN